MYKHGEAVELKGTLSEVSDRVYARGWTFGKMRDESRVEYKITGVLEGYVVGTHVLVRGTWKEDPKWGGQIAVDSLIVERLSGSPHSIESWFEKHAPEHDTVAELVIASVLADARWETLRNEEALLELGCDEEQAKAVALEVDAYLRGLEAKKALLDKGFTEQEATRILGRYRRLTDSVLEADPYTLVHDEVVAFHRVDQIATDYYKVESSALSRICGALTAALVEAARNGSTGLGTHELCASAAAYLGLYPDRVASYYEQCRRNFVEYNGLVQLKRLARDESTIARTFAVLARRNKEE